MSACRGGPTLGLGGALAPPTNKNIPQNLYFFQQKKKKKKIKILPPNFLIFSVLPSNYFFFDLAPPSFKAWVRH